MHRNNALDSDSIDQDTAALRSKLMGVPAVEHVSLDSTTRVIWLILRADVDSEWTMTQMKEMVEGYDVQVAFRPEHRDRQRVRFVEVKREELPDQQLRCRVTLEWNGMEYHGTAEGERGGGVELRTAAAAALDSVSSIVPGGIPVRLAGVKQVRAFDADLVVVSLYRPDSEPHNLVGAVVAGGDSDRAAVVAVLSALNRLLGNYLLSP
jgi:hypothetical protein